MRWLRYLWLRYTHRGGCADLACTDCATEWGRVPSPTGPLSEVDSTDPEETP